MNDEIEDLRRRLRESERKNEEDQRLREELELAREQLRPKNLPEYLESCHSLYLAIQVVSDPSKATQGVATNPVGRICPARILPWNDFAAKQEEIWNALSINDYLSQPAFPTQNQMELSKESLRPISSENGLRTLEFNVVESAVERLINRTHADPLLRSTLGLPGTATFKSHTNLGATNDPLSESMEGMSLGPPAPKPRRKARGKGNLADQFCVCRTSEGQSIPKLAIEYKPPHKLTEDQLVTGLKSEIQLERDVINKVGEGFDFAARRLAAAVVTQLFSYMIGKGLQYGYVSTGQTLTFCYIPDDPSEVYVSVCVPSQDVMDDDETRLHRTAVAQVFAFVLRALCADPPSESWHDEAEKLGTWAVEYEDILKNTPASERKGKQPRNSPYKPQRWTGFKRSPVRTRSGCRPPQDPSVGQSEDDDRPSPSPGTSRTGGKVAPSTGTGSGSGKQGQSQGKQQQPTAASKPKIQSRPFCTHRCLLGLAYGGPTDESCPNADCHGQTHINRLEFLKLIRDQLATDRGKDADCAPLYRSGSRGSLFKVRLSSHGYTLVAKGVESLDLACLQHEKEMYDRLQSVQGEHVPVCLGTIDLVLPYYYDCGVYVQFLFLSWAGEPIFHCTDVAGKARIDAAVGKIFKALHRLHILHRDAELRNILYDTDSGQFMAVDFERSEFRGRQPLGLIESNSPNRKRKRKEPKDEFTMELQLAMRSVSGYAASIAFPSTQACGGLLR
ncbi:hypothetical protein XA68_14286 [Ophiocordyceps unilateralis]|uniref:Protein kinase domain-containing protein n=1 Tax=Ophiocordyceps unilateralis TaxID=268505 RepID=A0A2A9PMK1_OPHUN|nr:hypothetical protein XA68_14286 [Ophiocordyceps unilateralis]